MNKLEAIDELCKNTALGMTVFGYPVKDLDKDRLIKLVNYLGEQNRQLEVRQAELRPNVFKKYI